MSEKQEPEKQQGLSFFEVLEHLNDGQSAVELEEKFKELLIAAQSTGDKGEMTLKLKVKPSAKADGTVIEITDDIKLRLPEFPRTAEPFYINDRVELSRKSWRQKEIAFEPVTRDQATG